MATAGQRGMLLALAAHIRLSQLAQLADSVLVVAPPSIAVLQPGTGRATTTALHGIRERISRLSDIVAAMQAHNTPEERQRPAVQHGSPSIT
ncbi:hypothetical protein MRX96_003189 [Rhipicephalus microplus]